MTNLLWPKGGGINRVPLYFVIAEPKKVSQVLEKKVLSLHGLRFEVTALALCAAESYQKGTIRQNII